MRRRTDVTVRASTGPGPRPRRAPLAARRSPGALCGLALIALGGAPLAAQAQAERSPAAIEVGRILRQLDGVKRILMIGAHPDDEDASLLAAVGIGQGAEVAYLSLTRGEGGQNRVGEELGEALGLLRTAELLAARRLDGARQFFTRAYDFGYSRDTTDAFSQWPRDTLLADLVWVIRRFRPQVVISVFGGTEEDGHGQHRVAGRMAAEAFEAAADSTRFPSRRTADVGPWRASKLYVHARRDSARGTLSIATGALDPLLGRSPHQLALHARGLHRSQAFGAIETPGAHASWLRLARDLTSAGPDASLFAGIDTSLVALAARRGASRAARRLLRSYREQLARAEASLRATAPEAALPALAAAASALDGLLAREGERGSLPVPLRPELERRRRLLDRAILAAAGIRLEALASDAIVVPGQRFLVRARLWNGGAGSVRLEGLRLEVPPGWEAAPSAEDFPVGRSGPFGGTTSLPIDVVAGPAHAGTRELPPGAVVAATFEVRVSEDAVTSSPYYLREPRPAVGFYRWPDDSSLWGLPFQPLGLTAVARLAVTPPRGPDVRPLAREAAWRRELDRTEGEVWSPVRVAPALSLQPTPELLVVSTQGPGVAGVEVAVRSAAVEDLRGELRLEGSAGWSVEPAVVPFRLVGEGAEARARFTVRTAPSTGSGSYELRAVAVLESGRRLDQRVWWIAHPHVRPHLFSVPATVRLLHLPIEVPRRRVAFVEGPVDAAGRAMERLGLDPHRIEPDDWSPERLDAFDVIVVGVRAYETRPDLVEGNPLLLDWVRRGGTLIIQYQRYDLMGRHFAPYPLEVGRPVVRVTDERAPVTFLDPAHGLLVEPNRLTPADFEGWVQERATFMPRAWDERYRPVLEMADPGEPPARGGLLVASVGEGRYAHLTLSLFRQLEAGVPGAYRILANLLALGRQSDPDG